ncbi:MAG: hypothetical protein ACP5D2_04110 [Candidatus Nanoarchaeia archaeon]
MFGNRRRQLMPGCRLEEASSGNGRAVIVCDTKKIVGDRTEKGERPIKLSVENGKLFTKDDGGHSSNVVEEVQRYVKKNFKGK